MTEVFAAVLESVPGLARALVDWWYGPLLSGGMETRDDVRTQSRTGSGGIVDLALRVRPRARRRSDVVEDLGNEAPPRDVVCWVEIKHRDPPPELHGPQLETYLHDIEDVSAGHRFVRLLAPRGFDPPRPAGVDYSTWQEVARWLSAYLTTHHATIGEVDKYLIGQLLRFLQEEGLMDPGRLTAEHAFIADALPSAATAYAALWEVAEGVIFNEWLKPRPGGMRQIMNMYRVFDLKPPDGQSLAETWRGNFLEWGMRPDDFLGAESRQALVFYAGLTITSSPKQDPLLSAGNRGWLATLEGNGFRHVVSYYPRIWRLLYVDELLTQPSLEEQGQQLGRWVLAAFTSLCAAQPPS
ncbi:MAG: hypothetical protein JO198_12805 [Candidatus Dormibacteraeota bacterium]|nr:hypothetical protein [Candidatus Dormibacteraeota bacterium]